MNISSTTPSGNPYAWAASRGRDAGVETAGASGAGATRSGKNLTTEQQQQVQKLKQRDQQVRQHEQAHMSAGAGLITRSASFTYQKGPDGVNYAIGGEVGISTTPGRTPDETIQRAGQIRAAALAPANPSAQDHAVAARATQMEQQARLEKSRQTDPEQTQADTQKTSAINRAYTANQDIASSGLSIYA